MRKLLRVSIGAAGAALALSLAACSIEQTPERYIDHQQTPAEEIAASEAELRSRLNAMVSALQRRNLAEVAAILMAHPDLRVIGPREGQVLDEGHAVAEVLHELAGPGPGSAEEVYVSIGPRGSAAWFRVLYSTAGDPEVNASFRFSGVLVRHNGEWRLLEGHISRPVTAPPPSPVGPADTLQAAL